MILAARRGHAVAKVDVEPERRMAGNPRGASLGNVILAGIDLVRLWCHLVLLRRAP